MTNDDTRARFLTAIAEKLPAPQIVELHVFPPIRQGGMESGVAVVAVREGAEEQEIPRDARDDRRAQDDKLAVYTARYRLVLKGPERGKWECSVQVEADAPLVTVDKVVQGVQRRSGDAEDPEKLSGDDFRSLTRATPERGAADPSSAQA